MALRSWAGKEVADATRYWWVLLVSGILWVLLSLAILQFNMTSVWSIAILTGIVLVVAAGTEFAVATIVRSWAWAHALLGVVFLGAGVIAFAWPQSTFVVLTRLIAWYLLFLGAFEIAESLGSRRTDLWWLRLLAGVASIAVAFWAIESFSRSAVVLVLWVGLGALFRGFSHIFLAFEVREMHEEAKSVASPPAGRTPTSGTAVPTGV